MSSDLLHSVLSNIWVVFLVVLLFGGSIFVHELGHFLAARRRGAHVERFSIGFGPAIWSWEGRDGVEYRISWIPLGGYVLLPQLADLGALEGESRADIQKLPPVGYATKMIVFVAGAAFNVLFAFALACVVWVIGQPEPVGISSTTIATVLPTLKTADGHEVTSPAKKAGLQPGDVVVAIDGAAVSSFEDIQEHLALSSGWNAGERQTIFTIRRSNETLKIALQPVISGSEKLRMVGFTPKERLVIGRVAPGMIADQAGMQVDDRLVAIEGKPILSRQDLRDAIIAPGNKPLQLTVDRHGQPVTLSLPHPNPSKEGADLGIAFLSGYTMAHPSPVAQVSDCVMKTFRTLWALVNPRSDIGINQLSGPIGIISSFIDVSRAGLPFALWFTILVNVNLAILNLLPVPVLDGGQMLFATISKIRGRALPTNFIMATQSVFMVLLFAMIGYISFFVDIPRIRRENRAEAAAEAPATTKTKSPAPAAAPATPTPAAVPGK